MFTYQHPINMKSNNISTSWKHVSLTLQGYLYDVMFLKYYGKSYIRIAEQ